MPRNITINYTPEGAFTNDREEIRDRTLDCIRAEVAPFGIAIPDIFLGEVASREAPDAGLAKEEIPTLIEDL